MKKDRLYLSLMLICLVVIIWTEKTAAQPAPNIISSKTTSISLKSWQIAKDISPKENIISLPDSAWRKLVSIHDFDNRSEGNWLLKTELTVADSLNSGTALGIFPLNFLGAYEIFWDGKKIAGNGKIGFEKNDEMAGNYIFSYQLPHSLLAKGNHTLIIRVSNHYHPLVWKLYYIQLIVSRYDENLKDNLSAGFIRFFIMGVLFIPFLFNLFLYFARNRKAENLIFSIICLIVLIDSAVSLIPYLINVTTVYGDYELLTYVAISIVYALLFPAFFIYTFSLPGRYIWLVLLINIVVIVFFTNMLNMFKVMSLTVLIISTLLTMWALRKKLEGSLIIAAGLAAAWIAYFLNFAFSGFTAVMVVCTSISTARQFARKEKAEQEEKLKSARLENELLKKNINPHFILNTLTSVIVWLRKDPKSAIKLIETLADEFRMINQISPLKQIPMRQEIELCRSHLAIMNFRKGSEFKIETVDIEEEESIPPMIFHTLIENGITHGFENKNNGVFTILRKRNPDNVKYIISNDGDFSQDDSKNSSGVGIKYIKSRLEESYPGRWTFTSARKDEGWETVIEIRDK